MLYLQTDRLDEAEPLLIYAVNESIRLYGLNSRETISTVVSLVELYRLQGRLAEAEGLASGVYAKAQEFLAKDDPLIIGLLNNLGLVYMAQSNFSEAEWIFKLVSSLSIDVFGERDPFTISSFNNLAGVYLRQRKFDKAAPIYNKVIEFSILILGADHPETINRINNFANLHFRQNDWSRAAGLWRESTAKLIARSRRGLNGLGRVLSGSTKTEAEQGSWQFWSLVKAKYRLVLEGKETAAATGRETFQIAQWALGSAAARSLAQMSARGATRDPDLAELVRRRQDLVLEWQRGDAAHDAALRQAADRRDREAEAKIAARQTAIDAEIVAIDKRIAIEFKAYDGLVNPEALAVEEVRSLLGPNEALILFLDTPEWEPTPEETFIWVVTASDLRWVRSPLGTSALTRGVQSLRCGLSEQEWATPTPARRCAELLGLGAAPDLSQPLPFNLGTAHELYAALFGRIEDMIAGKRLLIVSAGPLTMLPLHVLVTRARNAALLNTFDTFRGVSWLARQNAIVTLPAVSSLKALRRNAGSQRRAAKNYAGYGDPVLSGDGSSCREPKVPSRCPTTAPGQKRTLPLSSSRGDAPGIEGRATIRGGWGRGTASANTDDVFSKGASAAAVLERVRTLCPLPDSGYEIKCVAERYRGSDPLIRLGAEANERDLKAMSDTGELIDYRILHFATHGLLAGDVASMVQRDGEPALVLTPPDHPSKVHDDGLLTASEIAGLKLNADWIVLSACNTASGGKMGDEALSGLARAFFYAGGGSLLVSHWPVYSDAAVRLTTRAFAEFETNPNTGRSEALQASMISLMDDDEQPDNAHPAVWAPFVIVGEGAR